MESFLINCGLKEAFGAFSAHEIELHQTVDLNDKDIAILLPKIGHQLTFKRAIKEMITESENTPPAKRKRMSVNSATSSKAGSPDNDVKKRGKELTVEQILKTDKTMAQSLKVQANTIFENFAKEFKIDFGTSGSQLINGKIICPFCQEEITPQIRKNRRKLGWNLGNVKRHLMPHASDGVSKFNLMLEAIITEDGSNKERELHIKAKSDSETLHDSGKESEKESLKRSVDAESPCVNIETVTIDEEKSDLEAQSEVNGEGSSNQTNDTAETLEQNSDESFDTNQSLDNNAPEWTAFDMENLKANQVNDESDNEMGSAELLKLKSVNVVKDSQSKDDDAGSSNQTNGSVETVERNLKEVLETMQSFANNPPEWTAFGMKNSKAMNDESDNEVESAESLKLQPVNFANSTQSKDDDAGSSNQTNDTAETLKLNSNEAIEKNQHPVNNPPECKSRDADRTATSIDDTNAISNFVNSAFGMENSKENQVNDQSDNDFGSAELFKLKPVNVGKSTQSKDDVGGSSNKTNGSSETVERSLNEILGADRILCEKPTNKLNDKNPSELEMLNQMQVNVAVMDNASDEELPEWRKEGVQYGWVKLPISDKIFYPGFVLRDGMCKYITSVSKVSVRKYTVREYHESLPNILKDFKKLKHLLEFNRLNNTNYE